MLTILVSVSPFPFLTLGPAVIIKLFVSLVKEAVGLFLYLDLRMSEEVIIRTSSFVIIV